MAIKLKGCHPFGQQWYTQIILLELSTKYIYIALKVAHVWCREKHRQVPLTCYEGQQQTHPDYVRLSSVLWNNVDRFPGRSHHMYSNKKTKGRVTQAVLYRQRRLLLLQETRTTLAGHVFSKLSIYRAESLFWTTARMQLVQITLVS